MPRISEKRRIENQLASTIEAVALVMLLDSDSESEEAEEDDLLSWFSRTIQYPTHDTSVEALEALQGGCQSMKQLLSTSYTLTEASWLISACTERTLSSR